MTFYGVKRGSVVNIQLASNYKKIEMTSEVNFNLKINIVHYFTLSLSVLSFSLSLFLPLLSPSLLYS